MKNKLHILSIHYKYIKSSYWLSFLIIFLFVSCNNNEADKQNNNSTPVVKVFDNYLYSSDLERILPDDYTQQDSSNIVQTYINTWIQDQLMLHKAEDFLDEQKVEIDRKTQEFRNTLMIHKYKETIIETSLDSNISVSEIEEYYNAHKAEFKLNSTIIKGYFIRIPNDESNILELKSVLTQDSNVDLNKVFNFVTKIGGIYDDFSQNWSIFSEKILKMPVNQSKIVLQKKLTLNEKDEQFYYYMFVSNYMKSGKTAPLEYVYDKIASIIIQKKSTSILKQNKQEIYNNALKKGDIEYY